MVNNLKNEDYPLVFKSCLLETFDYVANSIL